MVELGSTVREASKNSPLRLAHRVPCHANAGHSLGHLQRLEHLVLQPLVIDIPADSSDKDRSLGELLRGGLLIGGRLGFGDGGGGARGLLDSGCSFLGGGSRRRLFGG